ncbi:TIR domain-containing protein [Nocardia cerradoensis]|uniref:nSTAND1 domain-containing NTPase n=2 Tax=Nocardia cerradoensis TaxID=85688 RepID=UPI001443D5E1|nr:TIR domain-containing protein [Nocardia cerradoensis]
MGRVFISHAGAETAQALAIKTWLIAQRPELEGEIFLDRERMGGIPVGTRWKDALARANARCEAVICVVSQRWLSLRECVVEYRTAETLGKRILPVRLEPIPHGEDITREWQACNLFGDPATAITVEGFAEPVLLNTDGLHRLLIGLREASIGAETFAWPPDNDPGRSPYRGWNPFDDVDAAVYFGRDTQILQGLNRLRGLRAAGTAALFAILGPSGSGKSSFLRAGLLPRLAREDRRFLVLELVRPERDPLTGPRGIAASIHATRVRFGLPTPPLGTIKAAVRDDPAAVSRLLTELQQQAMRRDLTDPAPPTLVLPIDQAEELLLPDVDGGRTLALVARLLTAHTQLIVAMTVRTDRYHLLQTAPQLNATDIVEFGLAPMAHARFGEVITGPATRATRAGTRLELAPDLVDYLLADSAEGSDTLPLLALTLARLHEDYAGTGLLTSADYRSLGGLRQVVQSEIDSVLSADPKRRREQLDILRTAFIPHLAGISADADQPVRRIARWDELPEAARPLIDELVDRRLLVKDDGGGETTVEVALESLLRQWGELAGWLSEQADELRTADSLERANAEWIRQGRNDAWLLTGPRLAEAEQLAQTPGFRERTAPAREFLAAARRRENARLEDEIARREAELRIVRQRADALRARARMLVALVVVALFGAGLAGIGVYRATAESKRAARAADDSLAARLVTQAEQQLTTRALPGGDRRALWQILAANRLSPGTAASALVAAQYQARSITKIFGDAVPGARLAMSPDSRWVATSELLGSITLWDNASGTLRTVPDIAPAPGSTEQPCRVPSPPVPRVCAGLPGAVAVGADGRWVVAATHTDQLIVWDTVTGAARKIGMPGKSEVTSLALSPDGRWAATGALDGPLRLWDTTTGTVRSASGHLSTVGEVAISADGRRVAANTDLGVVRVWNTDSDALVDMPDSTGHDTTAVALSPDGRWVGSGRVDGSARIWDTVTGDIVRTSDTGSHAVRAVSVTPDGRRLATGDTVGAVALWDTGSGAVSHMAQTGRDAIDVVTIGPDGRWVDSDAAGVLRHWDTTDGGAQTISVADAFGLRVIDPDGRWVAVSGRDDVIRLWDADSRSVRELRTATGRPPRAVAISRSARVMVTGEADGAVLLRDTVTGDSRPMPDSGHTTVTSVAISPDGRWVATGDGAGAVRIWDTTANSVRAAPAADTPAEIHPAAISPDGRWVILFDRATGDLRYWNTVTGHIGTGSTRLQGFSPAIATDGHLVIAGDDTGTLYVFDLTSGDVHRTTMGTHLVTAVALSPDNRWVAAGDAGGAVHVWNTDGGQPTTVPATQLPGAIQGLAFDAANRAIRIVTDRSEVTAIPAPQADSRAICAKMTTDMGDLLWRDMVANQVAPMKLCDGLQPSPFTIPDSILHGPAPRPETTSAGPTTNPVSAIVAAALLLLWVPVSRYARRRGWLPHRPAELRVRTAPVVVGAYAIVLILSSGFCVAYGVTTHHLAWLIPAVFFLLPAWWAWIAVRAIHRSEPESISNAMTGLVMSLGPFVIVELIHVVMQFFPQTQDVRLTFADLYLTAVVAAAIPVLLRLAAVARRADAGHL